MNMEPDVKKENLMIRLRNILNEKGLKLWLSPYYNEGKSNDEALQELAEKYHEFLNTNRESCIEMLQDLQNKSLERLEERNNFRKQGLASIRVKVEKLPEFSVHIELSDTIGELRKIVADKIDISAERLKLISSGKVLIPEYTLEAMNVKHGGVVLVLVLENVVGKDVLADTNSHHMLLEETKKDVALLMSQRENKYFTVTNQMGTEVKLPPEENEALIVAMSLHEKGRTAFKKENYSLALIFFLEGDNEFKQCRCDILQKVDNYALLNLDIVWTYLHLQSLHHLSDAEDRLKICEKQLFKSYGANLERLKNIKGSTGNESVLLVRLRLLQGILAYLLNRQAEAINKFTEVENYIELLNVDEEKASVLRGLGYSHKEAKFALRAAYNDLSMAIHNIDEGRKEKKRMKELQKITKFANKHVCLNGDLINLTVLDQMYNLGFTRLLSTQALMKSNNEINAALLWIENFTTRLQNVYPSYMVDALKQLEYDDKNIKKILKYNQYELNDACVKMILASLPQFAEHLLSSGYTFPSGYDLSAAGPSTSNATISDPEEQQKNYEAFDRLQKGITDKADDYLDTDLQSEKKFLGLYKSLLP